MSTQTYQIRWLDVIDQTSKGFQEAFGSLTVEQLNWKPDPTTWSIGQNIDHLLVTNASFYPIIDSLRAGTYKVPWLPSRSFLVKFNEKMIMDYVKPERAKRTKTIPIWEPTQSQVEEGVLQKFIQEQQKLKTLITNSQDLVEAGTKISSPFSKYIVYHLEVAFDIIVTHEQRHLAQAKEVLSQLP
ncbi:MAG: DinB family protein [Bacteroidota bacterium]